MNWTVTLTVLVGSLVAIATYIGVQLVIGELAARKTESSIKCLKPETGECCTTGTFDDCGLDACDHGCCLHDARQAEGQVKP